MCVSLHNAHVQLKWLCMVDEKRINFVQCLFAYPSIFIVSFSQCISPVYCVHCIQTKIKFALYGGVQSKYSLPWPMDTWSVPRNIIIMYTVPCIWFVTMWLFLFSELSSSRMPFRLSYYYPFGQVRFFISHVFRFRF